MKQSEEKILVAGTFNNDLESGDRMNSALDKFKPNIIIGETNQLLDSKASMREMIWAILFDECEVPVDIQDKWRAIQTHKEHLVAQNYANSKRIPYFMIDSNDDINRMEVAAYAQMQLIKEWQAGLTPENIRNNVRESVERRFSQLEKQQKEVPSCKKYYTENSLCKGNKAVYADGRGEVLAKETQEIIKEYPNSRIFAFFDGTQIVTPSSVWATEPLGRSMHNVRYHLGNNGIKYGMLVDLI